MTIVAKHQDTPILKFDDTLSEVFSHIESSSSSSLTSYSLLLIAGNQAISLNLNEGDFVILGHFDEPSRVQVDLSLLMNPNDGVSRKHAMLYIVEGYLYVADIGSTNGTYLRGKQLEVGKSTEIKNGDYLNLAKFRLLIQLSVKESIRSSVE